MRVEATVVGRKGPAIEPLSISFGSVTPVPLRDVIAYLVRNEVAEYVSTDPHISYSANGIESSYQAGYRFVVLVGRVGSEVHRVTVDVAGRGVAEASLNHGWVSVWWPGEVPGATLHVFDAHGRELAREPLSLD